MISARRSGESAPSGVASTLPHLLQPAPARLALWPCRAADRSAARWLRVISTRQVSDVAHLKRHALRAPRGRSCSSAPRTRRRGAAPSRAPVAQPTPRRFAGRRRGDRRRCTEARRGARARGGASWSGSPAPAARGRPPPDRVRRQPDGVGEDRRRDDLPVQRRAPLRCSSRFRSASPRRPSRRRSARRRPRWVAPRKARSASGQIRSFQAVCTSSHVGEPTSPKPNFASSGVAPSSSSRLLDVTREGQERVPLAVAETPDQDSGSSSTSRTPARPPPAMP